MMMNTMFHRPFGRITNVKQTSVGPLKTPLSPTKRPALKVADANKENAVSFDQELTDLTKYYKWQAAIEDVKSRPPLVSSYYSENIYRIQETKGANMLKKVEETVKTFFPKGRFPFQRDLHNQVLRATLRQTLGDDYEAMFEKVCKERGWKGPKKNLFAIASRRSGKTTAFASIVAALLVCIPDIEIVVYSVALRTAQEFVRLVERYIQMHPLGKSMIANPGGSEMLILKGTNIGDLRRIRSFPSGGNAKNVSFSFLFSSVCFGSSIRYDYFDTNTGIFFARMISTRPVSTLYRQSMKHCLGLASQTIVEEQV
jgi:hypothetical protein